MKSVVMQKYFIVVSSNMALCRRGLYSVVENNEVQ